jgi:hypothetical protein
MLRAQTFEGLFTLVPILLVALISILLRTRASRRRKRREEAARGVQGGKVQGASATIPAGRSGRPARAAGFPGQREISGVYPERSPKTPSAGAPGFPQESRGYRMTRGESYAYPPPLALDQVDQEPAAADGPGSTAAARQAVRPAAESRMAIEWMGPPGEARTPRLGRRYPSDYGRPATKAAAGRGSSIAARLERLPPLKRAVIWAEILGPPGGRQ